MPPLRAHAEAAAPGAVYLLHLGAVVDYLAAGGKVRRGERGHYVELRVADIVYRRLADLVEVEAAYLAGHTDGDAGVCGDEHIRERRGQERRLLHAAVIVVDKVDIVLVDVFENLGADGGELRLGIT